MHSEQFNGSQADLGNVTIGLYIGPKTGKGDLHPDSDNVSSILKLFGEISSNISHSDIDFVDVKLHPDNKLFIDPVLIRCADTYYSRLAHKIITDHFKHFFKLFTSKDNTKERNEFFDHYHEINAPRLGYGNGSNGKGLTEKSMFEIFGQIDDFYQDGLCLVHPHEMKVLLKDFAEDRMSDMLTNVLFKLLNEFTLEQCRKYGLATGRTKKRYSYWDIETHSWKEYDGESLIVESEVLLLLPKNFVRHRYSYNMGNYFSRVIAESEMDKRVVRMSNGKMLIPTKKDIKKSMMGGDSVVYDIVVAETIKHPEYLEAYNDKLPEIVQAKSLSDEELDEMLYEKSEKGVNYGS